VQVLVLVLVLVLVVALVLVDAIELASSVRRHHHNRARRTKYIPPGDGGDITNPNLSDLTANAAAGAGSDPGVNADWHLQDHCGARNRGMCAGMANCNSPSIADTSNKDCQGDMTTVCCYMCGDQNKNIAPDRCGTQENNWQGYCGTWSSCVLPGDTIDINSGTKCPVTCTGKNEICCTVGKAKLSNDPGAAGDGDSNFIPVAG